MAVDVEHVVAPDEHFTQSPLGFLDSGRAGCALAYDKHNYTLQEKWKRSSKRAERKLTDASSGVWLLFGRVHFTKKCALDLKKKIDTVAEIKVLFLLSLKRCDVLQACVWGLAFFNWVSCSIKFEYGSIYVEVVSFHSFANKTKCRRFWVTKFSLRPLWTEFLNSLSLSPSANWRDGQLI